MLACLDHVGNERRAIGAEALSGLARAFFYAGARSLLVSHWVVDDSATAALMSRLFTTAAAPGQRASEA